MASRYENNEIKKTFDGKQVYRSKIYPNIPLRDGDVYIITETGDRLDTLAYQYFKGQTLWWIIAAANNNATNGFLFPVPGTQLRIPTDLNEVLELVEKFNQAR